MEMPNPDAIVVESSIAAMNGPIHDVIAPSSNSLRRANSMPTIQAETSTTGFIKQMVLGIDGVISTQQAENSNLVSGNSGFLTQLKPTSAIKVRRPSSPGTSVATNVQESSTKSRDYMCPFAECGRKFAWVQLCSCMLYNM